jgi:exodeoxyribonuclease VII large subunit
LEAHADDLTRGLRRHLAQAAQTVDWLSRRLVSPSTYIAHERLKLRNLQSRLAHATGTPLAQARFALTHLQTRLSARMPNTLHSRQRTTDHARRLTACAMTQIAQRRQMLAALANQLELLNPQRTLERGYAIVVDSKGKVIRAPKDLRPREIVSVRLAEGIAEVGIASVQPMLDA